MNLFNHDIEKLALKAAIHPSMPDALIDRRKQAFATPPPEWLGRDSIIGSTIRDADAGAPVRELLDLKQIAELWGRTRRVRATSLPSSTPPSLLTDGSPSGCRIKPGLR